MNGRAPGRFASGDLGRVGAFSLVHAALFAGFGVVVSLVSRMRALPALPILALGCFVALEGGFLGLRADEQAEDPYLALMLSRMFWPQFPVPVGVLRSIERPTHDVLIAEQLAAAVAKTGEGDLARVLRGGETWTVE